MKPLSGCPQNHAPTLVTVKESGDYFYWCNKCRPPLSTPDYKSESAARRAWNALVEEKRKR